MSMMELFPWVGKTYRSHFVTLSSPAILRESKLILAGPIFLYWWTSTNHIYYWLVFFPTPGAPDTQTQSRQICWRASKCVIPQTGLSVRVIQRTMFGMLATRPHTFTVGNIFLIEVRDYKDFTQRWLKGTGEASIDLRLALRRQTLP